MVQSLDNPMAALARRVRSGDFGAAEEFRREMSLALVGMVRLALRRRSCLSTFEEYACAQADRLQQAGGWQLPADELARRTAERVCEDMIDRLQAGSRAQDTVTCTAAGPGGQLTVVSRQGR
jgi:hypothetical protein